MSTHLHLHNALHPRCHPRDVEYRDDWDRLDIHAQIVAYGSFAIAAVLALLAWLGRL